jgi:methyl coenzyme M reductase subunit D
VKNKEKLEELLIDTFEKIKHDKKRVARIKKGLMEYKVLPGTIQMIINEPEEHLSEIDNNLLCLLTEQTYVASGNLELKPENFFSPREIKEVKTTYKGMVEEPISFPYTLKETVMIAPDMYFTKITSEEIKLLKDADLLQYNFETQREARLRTDKDNPENIVREVKVNKKHVETIKESILKGEALPSFITFNARLGSADEGVELVYDEDKRELTIMEGTLLDVLDGFHRITAAIKALIEDPSKVFTFGLIIVNFDIEKARLYFTQMNNVIPIDKQHLERMKRERQSDFIVKQLMFSSELKGKIVEGVDVPRNSNALVTFDTLSQAIDEVYKIDDKVEAIKVANYLKNFFNTLFYSFPDEFLGDVRKYRDESIINANMMFYGYVILSKRMKDENIPVEKVSDIISKIDFSRNNKEWQELKILDENKHLTMKAKNNIKKFFEQVELG